MSLYDLDKGAFCSCHHSCFLCIYDYLLRRGVGPDVYSRNEWNNCCCCDSLSMKFFLLLNWFIVLALAKTISYNVNTITCIGTCIYTTYVRLGTWELSWLEIHKMDSEKVFSLSNLQAKSKYVASEAARGCFSDIPSLLLLRFQRANTASGR